MTVLSYLKNILFRPEYYFKVYSLQSNQIQSNYSVKNFFIVLISLTILLTCTRVLQESFFSSVKVTVAQEASAKVEENRKNYGQNQGFVFILLSKIIYVLIWIVIPILLSLIRLPILYFIGEHKTRFKELFITTLATSLPLLLSSFIISVMYDLVLSNYTIGNFETLKLFFLICFIILLVSWIWEGRLCFYAFTGQYDQNNGRAILTWLSPSLLFVNLLAINLVIQIWFR
ncbi:hypothetical protein [Leptospira noguchii]|uniref:hypothetical protein n=1 Tax=Leptospira noguchii TaxID=28182 RepID=UPI00034818B7|nr:hypothetical protein [Leptospira noguchii]TQE77410.1 hypothetical protein FF021_08460 [Leptospira noguchii]UOG55041.1 hypothetical protein MAL09_21600 [Leptospira noguchii]